MKKYSMLGVGLLLAAETAWAQFRPNQDRTPQQNPPPEAGASQAQPPANGPSEAPAAASSKSIEGTVEAMTAGKKLTVKMSNGKTKTFSLRDAAVDPSLKVGSPVRVTLSTDVNGKRTLTVEPGLPAEH